MGQIVTQRPGNQDLSGSVYKVNVKVCSLRFDIVICIQLTPGSSASPSMVVWEYTHEQSHLHGKM